MAEIRVWVVLGRSVAPAHGIAFTRKALEAAYVARYGQSMAQEGYRPIKVTLTYDAALARIKEAK